MSCPHHPDKGYIKKGNRWVCPECEYVAPSINKLEALLDLRIALGQLQGAVIDLDKAIQKLIKSENE